MIGQAPLMARTCPRPDLALLLGVGERESGGSRVRREYTHWVQASPTFRRPVGESGLRAYSAVWCPLAVRLPPIAHASTSPLWRVEGAGNRTPGVPFEPVGPGHPLSAQTPDLQPLVRIRKRGPTA